MKILMIGNQTKTSQKTFECLDNISLQTIVVAKIHSQEKILRSLKEYQLIQETQISQNTYKKRANDFILKINNSSLANSRKQYLPKPRNNL